MLPEVATSASSRNVSQWESFSNVNKSLYVLNTNEDLFRRHLTCLVASKLHVGAADGSSSSNSSSESNVHSDTSPTKLDNLVDSFSSCGPFTLHALATVTALEKACQETFLEPSFDERTRKERRNRRSIGTEAAKVINTDESRGKSMLQKMPFRSMSNFAKTKPSHQFVNLKHYSAPSVLDSPHTNESASSPRTAEPNGTRGGQKGKSDAHEMYSYALEDYKLKREMRKVAMQFKPSRDFSIETLRNNLSFRRGEPASMERKSLLKSIEGLIQRDRSRIYANNDEKCDVNGNKSKANRSSRRSKSHSSLMKMYGDKPLIGKAKDSRNSHPVSEHKRSRWASGGRSLVNLGRPVQSPMRANKELNSSSMKYKKTQKDFVSFPSIEGPNTYFPSPIRSDIKSSKSDKYEVGKTHVNQNQQVKYLHFGDGKNCVNNSNAHTYHEDIGNGVDSVECGLGDTERIFNAIINDVGALNCSNNNSNYDEDELTRRLRADMRESRARGTPPCVLRKRMYKEALVEEAKEKARLKAKKLKRKKQKECDECVHCMNLDDINQPEKDNLHSNAVVRDLSKWRVPGTLYSSYVRDKTTPHVPFLDYCTWSDSCDHERELEIQERRSRALEDSLVDSNEFYKEFRRQKKERNKRAKRLRKTIKRKLKAFKKPRKVKRSCSCTIGACLSNTLRGQLGLFPDWLTWDSVFDVIVDPLIILAVGVFLFAVWRNIFEGTM